MSGIVGIFHRDGAPVERAVLGRMIDAMIRRGPDAQRIWADGPIGLGHAALFTTLEADRENQPATLDGQVWITADARIDDWGDLRHKLEAKGRKLGTDVTDVDLILHAYHAWGERCVDHLIGGFSFVIWDAREQRLFCARDHMGIKPFHYYLSDKLFVFASEIRALLEMPEVPVRTNDARIADYLFMELEGIDKTSTFFCDIFRLPSANHLKVGSRDSEVREYWHLELPEPLKLKSDAEYAEAFNEHYTRAVVRRLRAPAPDKVGAMLSGGIDSASIVAIAREHMQVRYGARLNVFSAVTDDGTDLETRCSRAIVEQGGVVSHSVSPQQVEAYADDLVFLLSENTSLFDNIMEIPHLMNVLAKHSGVRVLLTGVCGDEVLSLGESYVADLLRRGRLMTAMNEAAACAEFYRDFGDRMWKTALIQARAAFMPRWGIFHRLRRHRFKQRLVRMVDESVLNREFADSVKIFERLDTLYKPSSANKFLTAAQRRVQFINKAYIAAAMERYDSVSAVHGVEARHPLLDKQLLEFCMGLPWNQKVRSGWTKHILRRSMQDRLPAIVCWRKGRSNLSREFICTRNHLEYRRFQMLREAKTNGISKYIKRSHLIESLDRFLNDGELDRNNTPWLGVTLDLWIERHKISERNTEYVTVL